METLAAVRYAPNLEHLRRCIAGLAVPEVSLGWIRLEFVLLTGAIIMAG